MDELRDVPGYEGLYAVTADGRVFSYARKRQAGRISPEGLWISSHVSCKGYLRIGLRKNGARKFIPVHRLVALAWLPTPTFDRPQVNHLNGNKLDNRATNLEWCTCQQNIIHAFSAGLKPTRTPAQMAALRRNAPKAWAATKAKHAAVRAANKEPLT